MPTAHPMFSDGSSRPGPTVPYTTCPACVGRFLDESFSGPGYPDSLVTGFRGLRGCDQQQDQRRASTQCPVDARCSVDAQCPVDAQCSVDAHGRGAWIVSRRQPEAESAGSSSRIESLTSGFCLTGRERRSLYKTREAGRQEILRQPEHRRRNCPGNGRGHADRSSHPSFQTRWCALQRCHRS